jgi:hypothetical protein
MKQETLKIEKVIRQGLAEMSIDLLQDYTEAGLDEILDNPALNEIPIVKSVIGLLKGGLAIREIHFTKKLLTFLRTFHQGGLPEEKRQQFLGRIKSDNSYRQAVIENIAVLNDRFISEKKSVVLANLLRAHINGCFGYEDFTNLSELLDSVHVRAFDALKKAAEINPLGQEFLKINYHDSPEHTDGPMLVSFGLAVVNANYFMITHHGILLYIYGIKGDINSTPMDFKHRS